MKLWMKLCLGVGTACVVLGCAAFATGCVLDGGALAAALMEGQRLDSRFSLTHVRPWADEGETKESRVSLKPFSAAEVELEHGNILFQTGTEYAIEITHGENTRIDYEVQGDVLTVWHADGFRPFGKNCTCSVTVTVPETAELQQVELSSDLGNVTAEHISARELYLSADMGEITATGVCVERLELDSDMGSISAEDISVARSVYAESDMGEISLRGDMADVFGECSMGSITLQTRGREEDYNYDLTCEMGSVEVNGDPKGDRYSRTNRAPCTMELHADMGNIEVTVQE